MYKMTKDLQALLFKRHVAAYLAKNLPYWWAHRVDILIPLIVLLFTVALMFHVPIQSAMHSGEKENISIGGVFFTGFVMTILLSCFWLVFVARGLKIKGSALLSKTPSYLVLMIGLALMNLPPFILANSLQTVPD
jgi:hypothetical protein